MNRDEGYLRHPVRPETERRTAIRQTVPTKAPDEAEKRQQ